MKWSTFPSKYSSRCRFCCGEIKEGENIMGTRNEKGKWVIIHPGCKEGYEVKAGIGPKVEEDDDGFLSDELGPSTDSLKSLLGGIKDKDAAKSFDEFTADLAGVPAPSAAAAYSTLSTLISEGMESLGIEPDSDILSRGLLAAPSMISRISELDRKENVQKSRKEYNKKPENPEPKATVKRVDSLEYFKENALWSL